MAGRPRKKKSPTPNPNDIGTPELRQHHRVGVVNKRAYVQDQVPLDSYMVRGYISPLQHEAGELLHRAYRDVCIGSRITMDLGRVRVRRDPRLPPSRNEILAEKRFREAMASVPSPSVRIIFNVCCLEEFASSSLRLKGRELNTSMGGLRESLNILAKHFGLIRHL